MNQNIQKLQTYTIEWSNKFFLSCVLETGFTDVFYLKPFSFVRFLV